MSSLCFNEVQMRCKVVFCNPAQIDVLVARTGKLRSLPSNPFVVLVGSPLKALMSDQLESYQTLKLKAVKMMLEQFDNGDKLKEPRMLFSSRTTSIA